MMVGMMRKKRATRRCRLFDLPPEIRNHIYTLALQVHTADNRVSIVRFSRSRFYYTARPRPLSVLSLLQTCRQIYQEAQGLFYDMHHLLFDDHPDGTQDLLPFLAITPSARLRAIRVLTFVARSSEDTGILLGLVRKLLPGLRALGVIVPRNDLGDDAVQELLRFEGLEDFRIIESISVQKGPEMEAIERAVRERLNMAPMHADEQIDGGSEWSNEAVCEP